MAVTHVHPLSRGTVVSQSTLILKDQILEFGLRAAYQYHFHR